MDRTAQRTRERKARALAGYRELGTVAAAVERAGIVRSTWYDWIERDSAFAEQVDTLREAITDRLEAEAIRRAEDGSDSLLRFLLRGQRREIYGDRTQIDASGSVTVDFGIPRPRGEA